MKPLLLISAMLFTGLASFAQTPNTVVNCWISNGKINYGHLPDLLPDSIKSSLLVDPGRQFHLKDGNNILLWLEQQGWHLLAVDVEAFGSNGSVESRSTYILSKEIYLDDTARGIFLQRLQNIESDKHN